MPILSAPWVKPLGLNYKTAAEAIRSGNITVALDGHNGAPTAFKGAIASIIARQNLQKAVTSLYGMSAITIAPYFTGSNLILPRQYAAFGGEVVELFDPTTLGDLTFALGALADGGYMLKMELFGALVGASTSTQVIPTGLAGVTDTVNKPGVSTLFGNGNITAGSVGDISDSPLIGGSTVQQQKYVQLQYKITLSPENNLVGLATTIDPSVNYATDTTLSPWGVSAALPSDSIVPESVSRAFVIARMDKLGSVYTVQAPLAIGATIPSRQNHAQLAQPNFLLTPRVAQAEAAAALLTTRVQKIEGGKIISTSTAGRAWKLCGFPSAITNSYAIIEAGHAGERTVFIASKTQSLAYGYSGFAPIGGAGVRVYLEVDGTTGVYFFDPLGYTTTFRYSIFGQDVTPIGGGALQDGQIYAPDVTSVASASLTGTLVADSNTSITGFEALRQAKDNHEGRLMAIENAPAKRFAKLGTSPFENSSTYPKYQTHYADGGTGSDPGWAVDYGGLADRTIGPTGSGADSIWVALNSIPGGYANRDIALTIQLYTSTASARTWIADGGYGGAMTALECATQNHKAFGASAKTSLHVIVKTDSQGRFRVRHQFDDYNVGTYHECFFFIYLNGYYVS